MIRPSEKPPRTEILVADDEATIVESLHDFLEGIGYRVFTARDGLAALEAFRAHPTPIVVSDINMPGLGGHELLLEIKPSLPRPR